MSDKLYAGYPFSTAGARQFPNGASELIINNKSTAQAPLDVTFYLDDDSSNVWVVSQGELFDEKLPTFYKVTVTTTANFFAYVRRR